MEEKEERKISKYSSGINIIVRLDNLWKDTHIHSRNSQYKKWSEDLDCIWLELARDYSENGKDWKEKSNKFEEYDKQIAIAGGFHENSPNGFESVSKDILEKRNQVYKLLMEKQLFLARIENELGKGTTEEEEEEDEF